MNKLQKLFAFIVGIIMIIIGIIVLLLPTDASFAIIAIIIGVCITLRAIKDFVYYLTSARHMISGKKVLISSFVEFEFGLLAFLVILSKPLIAMIYLVAIFIVLGVVDILRGIEIKRNEGKRWQLKIIKGFIAIGLGITCLVFGVIDTINKSEQFLEMMTAIFGIAWIVDGVLDIISSFYKSSIVYVDDQSLL